MVRLCVATVKNGKQNSFNGFTSAAKLLSFMGHFWYSNDRNPGSKGIGYQVPVFGI